jgi:hypothetical protein
MLSEEPPCGRCNCSSSKMKLSCATISDCRGLDEENEAKLYRLKRGLKLQRREVGSDSEIKEEQRATFGRRLKSHASRTRNVGVLATTSFARLLTNPRPLRRGAHDARRNLQQFTEGFDTADLKDAKALLNQLSALVAHERKHALYEMPPRRTNQLVCATLLPLLARPSTPARPTRTRSGRWTVSSSGCIRVRF